MERNNYFQFRRASIVLGLTSAFVLLGSVTFFFVMESTRVSYENRGLNENVDALVKRLGVIDQSVVSIGKYGKALDKFTRFSKQKEKMQPVAPDAQVNDGDLSQSERVTAAVVRINQLAEETQRLESRMEALSLVIKHRKDLLLSLPTMTPTEGSVSSGFGVRSSPFTGASVMHRGIDIKADMGSAVFASAAGTVIFSGVGRDLGRMVTIDHGYGIMTKYGHNSALKVKTGDKVRRGQLIALVGNTGHSTGPHLHYEVWVNDEAVDPIAFLPDLSREAVSLALNHPDKVGMGGEETVISTTNLVNAPLAASVKNPVIKATKDTQRWFWPMVVTMVAGLLLLISIGLSFTRSAPRQGAAAAQGAPAQAHFVIAEEATAEEAPLFSMKKAQ